MERVAKLLESSRSINQEFVNNINGLETRIPIKIHTLKGLAWRHLSVITGD